MADLDFCISQDEWQAADAAGKRALNDRANAAFWRALEVVHQNADWAPVEKDGILGIGAIKKPGRWKGSEFDAYGGSTRWGTGDLHPGGIVYKRAPNLVGTGETIYPSSHTKKYPLCPNTVMDTAVEAYRSFIKQMAALGAPWAEKIGVNSDPSKMVTADDIAAAATGPAEAAALAAKQAAIQAKKEAEEDALAQMVLGEYQDIEYKEQ